MIFRCKSLDRGIRITLISFFLLCSTKGHGADTQIWNRDTIEKKINEDWRIRLQTAFRWRDTTHLYHKFIQLFVDYYYSSSLSISPSYRQNIERAINGPWKSTPELMLDISKHFSYHSFHFSNRSRLQYEIDSNKLFYRNQLHLSYPFRWESFELAPFLTEEFFLLYFYKFDENRLGGGIKLIFSSKVEFLFYYLNLKEKNSSWSTSNVANLEVSFWF